MRYGTVVQYFPAKGFGFIETDFGSNVFFHVSALGACQPESQITVGQAVKYELERREATVSKSDKPAHPQAKLVELIDKIPGASLEADRREPRAARHPRAQKKKPRWRR